MSFIVLFRYKEYVQEYRDKYDSYLSLDKTLESDRYYNDFPRWVVLNLIFFFFFGFTHATSYLLSVGTSSVNWERTLILQKARTWRDIVSSWGS